MFNAYIAQSPFLSSCHTIIFPYILGTSAVPCVLIRVSVIEAEAVDEMRIKNKTIVTSAKDAECNSLIFLISLFSSKGTLTLKCDLYFKIFSFKIIFVKILRY
jgi:hypothetical protein